MSNVGSMIESRFQLGTRVRELRKEQHLTQTQLGQIVGLNRSQISRLECGHCNTTLDTILLVAGGLGITPSDLLSGIAAPVPTPETALPAMLTLSGIHSTSYHVTKL